MKKSQNQEVFKTETSHSAICILCHWPGRRAEDHLARKVLVLSGVPRATRVVARLRLRAATQLGEESANGPGRRMQGFPEILSLDTVGRPSENAGGFIRGQRCGRWAFSCHLRGPPWGTSCLLRTHRSSFVIARPSHAKRHPVADHTIVNRNKLPIALPWQRVPFSASMFAPFGTISHPFYRGVLFVFKIQQWSQLLVDGEV